MKKSVLGWRSCKVMRLCSVCPNHSMWGWFKGLRLEETLNQRLSVSSVLSRCRILLHPSGGMKSLPADSEIIPLYVSHTTYIRDASKKVTARYWLRYCNVRSNVSLHLRSLHYCCIVVMHTSAAEGEEACVVVVVVEYLRILTVKHFKGFSSCIAKILLKI